jgi:hypothetical protein
MTDGAGTGFGMTAARHAIQDPHPRLPTFGAEDLVIGPLLVDCRGMRSSRPRRASRWIGMIRRVNREVVLRSGSPATSRWDIRMTEQNWDADPVGPGGRVVMPGQDRTVSPGPDDHSVRTDDGEVLRPPADWDLLPPGDAALTRRVKAAGPSWSVQQRRGRRTFSLGIWAPRATIEAIRAELAAERATPRYARRREADTHRRAHQQAGYVVSFHGAVLDYLSFDPRYADLAEQLAAAVTEHATPVGSGTVARTGRIPLEARAEAAVIAWMRHQTTAYDRMAIPLVRGKRREVRRLFAQRSKLLLDAYRTGKEGDASACPLQGALSGGTARVEVTPA